MSDKKKRGELSAAMRRMTRLARLNFSEAELEKVVAKAISVLDYVEQLGELDTDDTQPTSHAVEMESRLREDESHPSGMASEIIDASPECDGPYVQVPRVIESE